MVRCTFLYETPRSLEDVISLVSDELKSVILLDNNVLFPNLGELVTSIEERKYEEVSNLTGSILEYMWNMRNLVLNNSVIKSNSILLKESYSAIHKLRMTEISLNKKLGRKNYKKIFSNLSRIISNGMQIQQSLSSRNIESFRTPKIDLEKCSFNYHRLQRDKDYQIYFTSCLLSHFGYGAIIVTGDYDFFNMPKEFIRVNGISKEITPKIFIRGLQNPKIFYELYEIERRLKAT